MVNVHKGKGDALTCGAYIGINLLEHVMKFWKEGLKGEWFGGR